MSHELILPLSKCFRPSYYFKSVHFRQQRLHSFVHFQNPLWSFNSVRRTVFRSKMLRQNHCNFFGDYSVQNSFGWKRSEARSNLSFKFCVVSRSDLMLLNPSICFSFVFLSKEWRWTFTIAEPKFTQGVTVTAAGFFSYF